MSLIINPTKIAGKITAEVSPKVTSSVTNAVTKQVATNANGVIDSNLSLDRQYYTKKDIDEKILNFMTEEQGRDIFVEKEEFLTNMEIEKLLSDN